MAQPPVVVRASDLRGGATFPGRARARARARARVRGYEGHRRGGTTSPDREYGAEPPWVCRRPQLSRDWGHERGKEVLPREPGAGGSAGAGPRGGMPVAVGGDGVDCGEERLLE